MLRRLRNELQLAKMDLESKQLKSNVLAVMDRDDYTPSANFIWFTIASNVVDSSTLKSYQAYSVIRQEALNYDERGLYKHFNLEEEIQNFNKKEFHVPNHGQAHRFVPNNALKSRERTC